MKKKIKKIKKIVRIKKKPLIFNFEEDTILLSNKPKYKKLFTLLILIMAFSFVKMGVFSPTEKNLKVIINDLNQKKTLTESGQKIKLSLENNIKKSEADYEELKNTFFDIKESDKFFDLIASKALVNQLKIQTIKKIKEGSYKEAKPIPPDAPRNFKVEYVLFENYIQSIFEINFEGSFENYLNFIYDIKESNKGLLTETSKITKNYNGNLKILSTLTINFSKSL
jgi:hypothetical protein|tara:strand:- start:294 stop:968 length:675 start_codon:yes stop_codon:yes gene_type:complete